MKGGPTANNAVGFFMGYKSNKNIYYDLRKSPFIYMYSDEIHFYFSSKLNIIKFTERIKDFTETMDNALKSRYHVSIDSSLLSTIHLYQKIEKRGFCILVNGDEVKWPEQIKLTFAKPMLTK